jgi:hypothetical protein
VSDWVECDALALKRKLVGSAESTRETPPYEQFQCSLAPVAANSASFGVRTEQTFSSLAPSSCYLIERELQDAMLILTLMVISYKILCGAAVVVVATR